VNGTVLGKLVQEGIERRLVWLLGLPADGCQPVPLEQALDLAEVRGRGRVLRRFDDGEAKRRRTASRETGSAPLDIGPDRIRDRAPLQELRGQTPAPT